jgi:hypothetical protein
MLSGFPALAPRRQATDTLCLSEIPDDFIKKLNVIPDVIIALSEFVVNTLRNFCSFTCAQAVVVVKTSKTEA